MQGTKIIIQLYQSFPRAFKNCHPLWVKLCHAPIVKNPFPCTPQSKTKFPLMHFNSEEYTFWEQGTQIFARR